MMLLPSFCSPASFSFSSGLEAAQVGNAAAGNDAFFNGGAGGVQRILDPGLLLLHLDLGGGADIDDRHAADQLGQTLLQLFPVVVGGGLVDLGADLLDPGLEFRSSRRRRR